MWGGGCCVHCPCVKDKNETLWEKQQIQHTAKLFIEKIRQTHKNWRDGLINLGKGFVTRQGDLAPSQVTWDDSAEDGFGIAV
jgi:hypothetical protein